MKMLFFCGGGGVEQIVFALKGITALTMLTQYVSLQKFMLVLSLLSWNTICALYSTWSAFSLLLGNNA